MHGTPKGDFVISHILVIIGTGSAMFTQGIVLDWLRRKPEGDREISMVDIEGAILGAIREVRVRADRAFFDRKINEFLGGKRAFYAIVTQLTRPLKNRLSGLHYQRISSGVWAAEFRYCPHG